MWPQADTLNRRNEQSREELLHMRLVSLLTGVPPTVSLLRRH